MGVVGRTADVPGLVCPLGEQGQWTMTGWDAEFVFVAPGDQNSEQRRASLLAQGIEEELVEQILARPVEESPDDRV
jgi:hypothetical protein